MNKIDFTECLNALRLYADWEKKMYDCGFDMNCTPVGAIADMLHGAMCDFDGEWSYDQKLEFDWIIEWTFHRENPVFYQNRHGREFELTSAAALYDFLVFMNEHGWEDE